MKPKNKKKEVSEPNIARWASQEGEKVLVALGSSRNGLSEVEVKIRLQQYGPNTLPRVSKRAWYVKLIKNFIHLFALLLWAGALLAWVAGLPQLAWAIVVVIVINGLFSFWQEFQAERAAEALRALLPHQVTVRREGCEKLVSAFDVVLGICSY
jgi:magnesium-transporting ATPase (P-type)